MTDRRRKRAIDEEANGVTVIMSKIPMLAAVRSTIWLGRLSRSELMASVTVIVHRQSLELGNVVPITVAIALHLVPDVSSQNDGYQLARLLVAVAESSETVELDPHLRTLRAFQLVLHRRKHERSSTLLILTE